MSWIFRLTALRDQWAGAIKKGETLDGLLPEVFACVREAAKRTIKAVAISLSVKFMANGFFDYYREIGVF